MARRPVAAGPTTTLAPAIGTSAPTATDPSRSVTAPAGAGSATAPAGAGSPTAPAGPTAPPTRVEVVARHPHDEGAYTQGLVLVGDRLFESTGQLGRSSVREVDLASGRVIRSQALAPDLFGEGLAAVDDRLVQLTWQNGVALLWSLDGLTPQGRFTYEGEGWGLCLGLDGRLVHSDGTSRLTFRDAATFAVAGQVAVTRNGKPLARLNELECTPEGVWANVYLTEEIVRIDPSSGEVTATVDASGLGPAGAAPDEVLNGIARRADGTWLLTGKHWPTLYEARFVP